MTTRDALRNACQLAGLWGFAFARPLFQVLESGEAFVLAGWRGGDVVLFALAFAFGPPLALVAVEAAVARVRPGAAHVLHALLVGVLAAVFVAYALRQNTELGTVVAMVLTLAAGALALFLYSRAAGVRSFVTLLGAGALLSVVLFLFGSPVKHLVFPADGAASAGPAPRVPVVMIVFDEFPTLSLLDAKGALDARSFPAFANLAREGTWFRNATSVADYTPFAVPAILTGRHQTGDRPGTYSAHPNNLLALLGRRGGGDAFESITRLCPRDVCDRNRPRPLPARITRMMPLFAKLSLSSFLPDPLADRLPNPQPFPRESADDELRRLTDSAARGGTLHYAHVQIPHQPWVRLPSGRTFPDSSTRVPDFATGQRWTRDPGRVLHMRQRHLAQMRYTDRVLGQALDRLRRSGVYDRALVIVAADHGIAFEPGLDGRRLQRATAEAILPVPLFVKPPGGRRGVTSDRFAQTIDIAPTIASVLGVRLPWKVDGRSLLDARAPERRRLVTHALEDERRLEFDPALLARQLRTEAAAQAALFAGSGPDRFFRTGRGRALIGRPVSDLVRASPAPFRHVLARESRDPVVHPGSNRVPALVGGRLVGDGAAEAELAVVVNARIAGIATVYRSAGDVRFNALVAEGFFRPGRNDVTLFAVSGVPDRPRLAPVAAAGG